MLLLGIILLPVVLTWGRTVHTDQYDLLIENDTLKGIQIIGATPDDLDLSTLGIQSIDIDVFWNLNALKSLNLADNSISSLPNSIFINLTNLEHLNLANNVLDSGHFYSGLNSLKTLNISHNPEGTFRAGHFFRLPRSVRILTEKFDIRSIGAGMFQNPATIAINPPKTATKGENLNYRSSSNTDAIELVENTIQNSSNCNTGLEIQICLDGNQLQSVKELSRLVDLEDNCGKTKVSFGTLHLSGLGIKTFADGWYQVRCNGVEFVDLGSNKITHISSQILNDLPVEVTAISLRGNQIKRLEKGVMKRKNLLTVLDLGFNNISVIEEGSLDNLSINDTLMLDGNQLTNTNFFDYLPSGIQTLSLYNNIISELSPGNFSRFEKLYDLDLRLNHIQEAKTDHLRGLQSLKKLRLTHNPLTTIETGFFQDLKNLQYLELENNTITRLDRGVFSGLEKIVSIDLSFNNLTEINSGVFSELPDSLDSLYINHNKIQSLKAKSFVRVPKVQLDLVGNRIVTIEKGTFDLQSLDVLDLSHNELKEIDGDSFEGLEHLNQLLLTSNNLTTIKKGTARFLNNLTFLDLTRNPIKMLGNGALAGLPKHKDTLVSLWDVPIEVVEGGLFDDV